MTDPADARSFHAHVARNKQPISEVLKQQVPRGARVLEIGCGSGEHAAHFAGELAERDVVWLPTDLDSGALASARAWQAHAGLDHLLPPLELDVTREHWNLGLFEVVYSANVIHIAPWSVCEGLVRGAARHLTPNGLLITYGPYRIGGAHTALSNADFDARLKAKDPAWGVRDLEAITELAASSGFALLERVPMPANNFLLVFSRESGAA